MNVAFNSRCLLNDIPLKSEIFDTAGCTVNTYFIGMLHKQYRRNGKAELLR